jgi:acetyl-CoA carboxylase carboxyltransferase component
VGLTQRKVLDATPEDQRAALRQQMIDFYNATVATPWIAAERGYIDSVIEPSATRLELRRALHLLRDKKVIRYPRKHHLLPL